MKILWTPTERQAEALRSTSFETLYGGARGGGKTDAGLAWLLYDKEEPLLRGLVLRKNAVDLGDWIARAKTFFRPFGVKTTGLFLTSMASPLSTIIGRSMGKL